VKDEDPEPSIEEQWKAVLKAGLPPDGLAGELRRWMTSRIRDSQKVCWVCGGIRTRLIDPRTRECLDCETHYGVFEIDDPPDSKDSGPHLE
jgi:hypothetical protein